MNAKINGRPVKEVIKDTKWLEEDFTITVQKVHIAPHLSSISLSFGTTKRILCIHSYMAMQRGGVLIQKWGRSSAASTAVSIVDAMRSLVTPSPEGDWFSTGASFLL